VSGERTFSKDSLYYWFHLSSTASV